MTRLADIAPRLARARDAWLAHEAAERRRRRRHRALDLRLEWLVAHREMQLIRAQHTGDAKYIERRMRKLDAAQRLLEQHRANSPEGIAA